MTLEQMKKYEEKVISFVKKYKKIICSVVLFLANIGLTISIIQRSIAISFISFLRKFYKAIRYLSFPFHWTWIKFDLWRTRVITDIDELPFMRVGAHYIFGRPGSGKSTSVYHAIMHHAYHTGLTALTTVMMEEPRVDNLSGLEYYLNQVFTPDQFYENGNQVAGFPEGFNKIVYEEMLGMGINQRNNKKGSYNDIVIPMIESMGTQRHQDIELFYFISQLPKNDIQIMQMITGYHMPKIKKAFDYKHWLETGRIRFYIKGWYFVSYDIAVTGSSDYELVNKQKYFYPCTLHDDMKYFKRLNMKDKYNKLKKAKGVPMYA